VEECLQTGWRTNKEIHSSTSDNKDPHRAQEHTPAQQVRSLIYMYVRVSEVILQKNGYHACLSACYQC
jgi:hypothetical protein